MSSYGSGKGWEFVPLLERRATSKSGLKINQHQTYFMSRVHAFLGTHQRRYRTTVFSNGEKVLCAEPRLEVTHNVKKVAQLDEMMNIFQNTEAYY